MSEEETWRYLGENDLMFVAFVREDGYPHVTPVWFVADGRKVYYKASSYKMKVRLAATGKVCCAWESGETYPELKGVVLWGRCEVIEDPVKVERVNRLMAERYAGRSWDPARVPEDWAHRQRTESKTIVEISPERTSSWDNSKLNPDSTF